MEESKTQPTTSKMPKRIQTKGEEIFNAVTHIVGGGFAVVALVIGIVFAALYGDGYAIVSMIVYGVCMILLYVASSIYHFLRPNKAKRLFRIFDHCTIFLLIAGTYTPFCLISLRNSGAWGWTLFGVIWFFAILGIVFNSINMHNKIVRVLSMIAYLAMGWCAVIAIVPLFKAIALGGFLLLIAGGVAYTVGAVLYVLGKKKKWIHSVWHLFVLAGSLLHFFAILFYVLL